MKMDNVFFDKVTSLIEQARSHIGRTADLTMCVTYYKNSKQRGGYLSKAKQRVREAGDL
jgi:hypothetical protein